jgi:hypothetical protein
MIWYELSKGKLRIPDPSKYTLVCTYLTLMELAFSPNNFNKLNEVQNAIRQILDCEPELILLDPYKYARTLFDETYNPDFNIEDDLVFAFLRGIINHPTEGLIENEFKRQLSDIIKIRKENSADWSNFLNRLYGTTKETSRIFKKYRLDTQDQFKHQNSLILELNEIFGTSYSNDNIDWAFLSFYEKIYTRYRRNLIVSQMKADINDENDLKNMIYVHPTDLYWTLEKRWLAIAKEMKLEEYLYLESN